MRVWKKGVSEVEVEKIVGELVGAVEKAVMDLKDLEDRTEFMKVDDLRQGNLRAFYLQGAIDVIRQVKDDLEYLRNKLYELKKEVVK